jgi:hypothetical protein
MIYIREESRIKIRSSEGRDQGEETGKRAKNKQGEDKKRRQKVSRREWLPMYYRPYSTGIFLLFVICYLLFVYCVLLYRIREGSVPWTIAYVVVATKGALSLVCPVPWRPKVGRSVCLGGY